MTVINPASATVHEFSPKSRAPATIPSPASPPIRDHVSEMTVAGSRLRWTDDRIDDLAGLTHRLADRVDRLEDVCALLGQTIANEANRRRERVAVYVALSGAVLGEAAQLILRLTTGH